MVFGFEQKLSPYSSLHAEMWAIVLVMQVTWEKGFREIIIESNCKETMEMINKTPSLHYLTEMIWKIKQWIDADWQVKI